MVFPSWWLSYNKHSICIGARISANDDAQSDVQSDNDDDDPASVLETILGRQVGRREDTVCDKDGVDVSVGVDDEL